jgi:hypothetical protein
MDLKKLDSGFRRNDIKRLLSDFLRDPPGKLTKVVAVINIDAFLESV